MEHTQKAVIELSHASKAYAVYAHASDQLKEAFSLTGKIRHREVYALRDVSFRVERGECVGVIGLNGAGKSTLLRMLTGAVCASEGSVDVCGRISALLELGGGLWPEYTGMENIYLYGALQGWTKETIKELIPEILAFADIGEFIRQPVRTYSSGMAVRLAFAMAVCVQPDVLLIDEALSVGDVFFQQKCYQRIRELSSKATVMMVSHDMHALTKFCRRILVLNHGVLVYDGEALQAVAEYYRIRQGRREPSEEHRSAPLMKDPDHEIKAMLTVKSERCSGKMEVRICRYIWMVNGVSCAELVREGDLVHIELLISSSVCAKSLIADYKVLDAYGNEVFGETNLTSGFGRADLGEGEWVISYDFRWPLLRAGHYFITPGIGTGEEVLMQTEQCWINQAVHLVNDNGRRLVYGMFNQPMENFRMDTLQDGQ